MSARHPTIMPSNRSVSGHDIATAACVASAPPSPYKSRLPPVTFAKPATPTRNDDHVPPKTRYPDADGAGSLRSRGSDVTLPRGQQGANDQRHLADRSAANRRLQLARRNLSNSLQLRSKTVLPVLRRARSFGSVTQNHSAQTAERASPGASSVVRRETPGGREGGKTPSRHDAPHSMGHASTDRHHDVRWRVGSYNGMQRPEVPAGPLRRTRSLRVEGAATNNPDLLFPHHSLTHSLPLNTSLCGRPGCGGGCGHTTVSLASLIHQLNASMHYYRPISHDNDFDDDDDDDDGDQGGDFNSELNDLALAQDRSGGLDTDLCPALADRGKACTTPVRTLTPALRKLNKRKVSSRVRTQQWVNQLESATQRRSYRPTSHRGQDSQVAVIEQSERCGMSRQPQHATLIFDQLF